jgi:hypothetical protein
MNPQIPKATAPMFRSKWSYSALLPRLFLVLACLASASQALFESASVTAFRVADDKIKVDGSPDTLWKAVAVANHGPASRIDFTDYGKMVILKPDSVRNDDPAKYFQAPAGYVSLLAAYDSKALYFYFQVKAPSVADSKSLCATADNLWKADAAEIFIDPSPWSQDTAVYRSYFSADAGGLVYGTSPKTIQMDRPISDKETRVPYFRSRITQDRFQIPASLPAGATAASKRNSKDTSLISVEMKIPFWTYGGSSFSPGAAMFISWGYNMYPKALWGNCNSDPIAYRWAKHYLSYEDAATKPPGWHAQDSTHYDPLRSWDGWGRFSLSTYPTLDPKDCKFQDTASWDIAVWSNSNCGGLPTTTSLDRRRAAAATGPVPGARAYRDVRGRAAGEGRLFIFPWEAASGGASAPL